MSVEALRPGVVFAHPDVVGEVPCRIVICVDRRLSGHWAVTNRWHGRTVVSFFAPGQSVETFEEVA